MGYNIRVQVALVVVVSSLHGPTNSKILLLKDRRLPAVDLSNKSIQDTLTDLLKQYIHVEPQWVKLVQGFVIDKVVSAKEIILPFGCMIPEEISISNETEWFSLGDLFKEQMLTKEELAAIQSICLRL